MDSRVLRGSGMRHMSYAPSSEHCTIVFHHGGFIVNHPKVAYTGTNISFFDMFHMDSMSMLEEIVEELMPECDVGNVGISEKVKNVKTIEVDLTYRNAETERTFFSETVRNAETVRTYFSESEDEDANYVASESEHSDSPFEDSENDIVDDDVCDVPVEVGRDIHGFTVGSNEETDEETNS
ncbi:hypothetical protein V6N13_044030 [Hibiscus sabdariffa]